MSNKIYFVTKIIYKNRLYYINESKSQIKSVFASSFGNFNSVLESKIIEVKFILIVVVK